MFVKLGFLLGLCLLSTAVSLAQSEDERRQGFYQKQEENRLRDQVREAGLKDFLKEQAAWEEQRIQDRKADKARRKMESPKEDGPEYKADRRAKQKDYEEYQELRKAYAKELKSKQAKTLAEQKKRDAWAMEEYGLNENRPRFDIAKRNLYGSGSGGSSGGGSSSSGSGRTDFGGNPSFPPAPFEDNDGFVPPPPPSFPTGEFDDGGFVPPPPMPFPGDPGSDFDGNYFPPPPPPIPPPDQGF